jgi:hypothetical protein
MNDKAKKLIIILSIIVPTVLLTSLLLSNKDSIGSKKNVIEETVIIKGMVCSDCEGRVHEAFKGTKVKVLSVDYDSKKAVLRYDKGRFDFEWLNKQLSLQDLSASPLPKDKLKLVDYKIRYN